MTATEARPRRVTYRTRGHSHGPITRLASPSDAGELIKPFVFLDYFDIDPKRISAIGFNPHSGIATLTLLLEGQIYYEETSGTKGIIKPRALSGCVRRAASGTPEVQREPPAPRATSYGSLYLRRWKASNPKQVCRS